MPNVADLTNTKAKMGISEGDDPKKKKIKTQYGKYSGIIDDKGKTNDNPTVLQATKNMVQYLKHNTPESNTYRPEHAHTSVLYNRKRPTTTA